MAQIAEKLADQVIATDDNPRTEDPAKIMADIRAGFTNSSGADYSPTREAIKTAI